MAAQWRDEERIMISALEHYAYCPRQCALIHLEDAYEENLYTLRGNRAHRRTDEPATEKRGGIRTERALPLFSDELGLTGRADVVEYRSEAPYPIEYKHGKKRHHRPARIQLCAQALCLEEMTGRAVPTGALYHTGSKRRQEIDFTQELRAATRRMVHDVRRMLTERRVPPPVNDARCPNCSLIDACMPEPLDDHQRQRELTRLLFIPSDE